MRKHVDCIATLAQLVERLTRNEKVAGPIPASGSDYLFTHSYSELLCASGGIGRRAGFRFLFHWSEGSSPFSRTCVMSRDIVPLQLESCVVRFFVFIREANTRNRYASCEAIFMLLRFCWTVWLVLLF